MAGLAGLFGRGTFPFISSKSPCILSYNGCLIPVLSILINGGFVLCGLCSIISGLWFGQPVCLAVTSSINTCTGCPADFLICCHKYCFDNIVVPVMCLVLCVISLPVFITQMVYESLLWSLLLGSTHDCVSLAPQSSRELQL